MALEETEPLQQWKQEVNNVGIFHIAWRINTASSNTIYIMHNIITYSYNTIQLEVIT